VVLVVEGADGAASLAALRGSDRVIVHFTVALLAVVTCIQARALREPYGVEGREILYLRLMLVSEALALAEDLG
jgi:hypothetical protein